MDNMTGAEEAQARERDLRRQAAATGQIEDGLNQLVIILQDTADKKGVEVAGAQRPPHYDSTSPSHIVGGWIRDNLNDIIVAAVAAHREREKAPALVATRAALGELVAPEIEQ